MLRVMARVVPVSVILLALVVIGVRVSYGMVHPPATVRTAAYGDPACISFCWNGLEARMTPATHALDVIEQYDILYRDRRSGGEALAITFQVDEHAVGMAWMGMELERLQFNFDACPLDLILMLGTPDRVRQESDRDDVWLYYRTGASLRLSPHQDKDGFHTLYFWDRSQIYRYVYGTHDRAAINWSQALTNLRAICQ